MICLNGLISSLSFFFTAVCHWDLGPRFTHIKSFHNVFPSVVLWKWAKSCCFDWLFCSVCNWFVVGRDLNPGPRLLPAESASGLPPAIENYDRGGCDRKHQASPLLLWLWQKCGFSLSPPPLTHSQDNIVQPQPAGALSCNPIELQQKAWLATTPLLSDSPTHCFPPFFRPSSSLARNMDKEICALNIFNTCHAWFLFHF